MFQSKQTSILGIALEGRFVQFALIRRSNGEFHVQSTARVELTLDPLTSDPELVGRELRKHLDAAEIREKRCALSLPLNWALTLHLKVPRIPEADISAFLSTQAERGFPYGLDELVIASSRYCSSDGSEHATLIAMPKGHLDRVEQMLKAAGLRPSSFSINVDGFAPPDEEGSGVVALLVCNEHAEVHVLSSGGILVLRSLDGALADHDALLSSDALAREIRITLGQLSKEFRSAVTRLKVIGPGEQIRPVAETLQRRCSLLGLTVETAPLQVPGPGEPFKLNGTPLPPSMASAARRLQHSVAPLEFLAPKPNAWTRRLSGLSSRQFVLAGMAGATALAIAIAAFAWQYSVLAGLESEWRALEPQVSTIDHQQQQIRKFRAWYDETVLSLQILDKITEAFPEDGAVTAKSIDLRYPALVSCTGSAKDNQSLLKVLDALRASAQVDGLQVDQMRGKSPLQFTFRFKWIEGGSNEAR